MEPQRCKRHQVFFSHQATKPRRTVLCFHRESTRDRLFSSVSIPLYPLRIPSCLGVLVSWCLGVLVSWCLGVLVSWCLGVLVSWCLGVRFNKSTSTGTTSKLMSVSGIPAKEDAAPSNLQYRSKLGTSTPARKYWKHQAIKGLA